MCPLSSVVLVIYVWWELDGVWYFCLAREVPVFASCSCKYFGHFAISPGISPMGLKSDLVGFPEMWVICCADAFEQALLFSRGSFSGGGVFAGSFGKLRCDVGEILQSEFSKVSSEGFLVLGLPERGNVVGLCSILAEEVLEKSPAFMAALPWCVTLHAYWFVVAGCGWCWHIFCEGLRVHAQAGEGIVKDAGSLFNKLPRPGIPCWSDVPIGAGRFQATVSNQALN